MKKITFFTCLMLSSVLCLFGATAAAKIVISNNAIMVKEHQNKLYAMPRVDWHSIDNAAALTKHELKPAQWYKIIAYGDTQLATALLETLAQFLPKDDLKPLLKLAIKRPADARVLKRNDVPFIAYKIWQQQYPEQATTELRKHPAYRQNLLPSVLWLNLFDVKNNRFKTTEEAIDFLRAGPLHGADNFDNFKAQAIKKISEHQDSQALQSWMNDENFHIALASWIGLSKQIPQQVASDVLSLALWWQEEITYTYGSGCIRYSGKLTPLLAALDLYSDYLSSEQIHKALVDVPEFWQTEQVNHLSVNNQQMYQALKKFNAQAFSVPSFKYYHSNATYLSTPLSELRNFLQQNGDLYRIKQLSFNQVTLDFLIDKLHEADSEFSHDYLVKFAFQSKNNFARQYIAAIIAADWQAEHLKYIASILLVYPSAWPQGWQDLKDQAINKFLTSNKVDGFSPVSVRLSAAIP